MQTRGMLDKELAQIQDNILQLGSMLEHAIRRSVEALKNRDVDLAQRVIADDQKINDLRYATEELCLAVIATQQPVAGDLRRIIAAMHIAIEIERMADHAEGIAHLVARIAGEPLLKPLIDIPRMAEVDCDMLRMSLDAYIKADVNAAKAAAKEDDKVDQLYDQIFRELLTYMLQDAKNINRATFLLWVAHNLERIGDRATNISERVLFMTTGKLEELKGSWDSENTPI
ncbi:MAG: phosphate signaling complex protein PhoU [Anaerolineales bacterium]|nr:phosphate signaling complex protein PhoU [Anaerolineales bacterium]